MTKRSIDHISAVLDLTEQPALLVNSQLKIIYLNPPAISLLGDISNQNADTISYFIPILGILNNVHNNNTQLPYSIKSDTTDVGTLFYTVSKPDVEATYSMVLIKQLDKIETKKVPPKDYRQALLDMEKMRTMKLIAAGAAHEINNPLGGIMQSVQVLSRVVDLDDRRTVKKMAELEIDEKTVDLFKKYFKDRRMDNFLEIIRDCGERSAAMIKQLLGFCRFKEIKNERLILNELLETVLFLTRIDNYMRKIYDFRFTKIIIEPDSPNLEIIANDQTLAHAMFLLFKQMAIKQYARRKEQDVETEMNFRFSKNEDGSSVLEVQDNGMPFSEDELEIFKKDYFELEPENELICLPISRHLVENENGGRINIEPSENGNKISFWFPLQTP